MLFNSTVFLKFLAAFLLGYYLVRHRLRVRNLLIVVASYVFYGWWDWRFLSLIFISTVLDYAVALGLERAEGVRRRKGLLALSLCGNLGILGFFKYYDFFATSLASLFARAGVPFNPGTLGIILPVGISFYTFQTMSYTFDVYRRRMAATHSFVNFMAYVAFFPQLVAGPIERARHLLPQFGETRTVTLTMIERGAWLILWGMFKKVVLADNLAPLVDMVYAHDGITGAMIVLGTIAFAFQIYCDFSGYSDIARGLARVLGFDIMFNFNIPYAARNVREFWRRWHISLSTWLRDYLYISLGGNRHGRWRTYRNVMITMLLGGLWHGAAWHFVAWGAWHGVGLIIHRWWTERTGRAFDRGGVVRLLACWVLTMAFVLYSWLLFRAESMAAVQQLTATLFTGGLPHWWKSYLVCLGAFTCPLVVMQVIQERSGDPLIVLRARPWIKGLVQAVLLLAIILYWEAEASPFIYFQF